MFVKERTQKSFIRDLSPYSTRNTSKGALLKETAQLLNAVSSGLSLPEVRTQAQDGALLHQRAFASRSKIWRVIHYRLFTHNISWVIEDLKKVYRMGPHSPEFISIIYLHYALRDRLTFDFVTQVIWQHWIERSFSVSRDDILSHLDQAAETQQQIQRWSESSRRKLASIILSALRDFGLLRGKQKKMITLPPLPLFTAEHILRILTNEGLRGSEVLSDPTWRLFLRTSDEVAHIFSQLAQVQHIRFERAGSTVVLETPNEWRASL